MAGQDGSRVKLTYEDYCRFPDDGKRHEILDGDHHVTPAPRPSHQSFLVRVAAQFEMQVGERDLVYVAPCDVQLTEVDILQPDLLVVAPHRRHIITPTKIKGVPDLVVEVLSPSTEAIDRGLKKERYAKGGVPEYWIADLEEHRIEQYVLEGGEYRLVGKHEDEVCPRVRGLAHVRLEVRKLW